MNERPDPPRKNDQNRREVAGQNKGPYLNFLQKRKLMMEQYHNTDLMTEPITDPIASPIT